MTILEAIASGKYDKILDRISLAVQNRKADRLWDLRPGDKVRISRQARPSYIAGRTGTIKEFRRTRILVMFDNPETLPGRKFRMGIICHPQSLEPVESEVAAG